jgi:hypothetical protein
MKQHSEQHLLFWQTYFNFHLAKQQTINRQIIQYYLKLIKCYPDYD